MLTSILIITRIFTKYAQTNPGFYFLSVVFFPLALLIPLFILVEASQRVDIFIGSAICTTTIMTIADISDIVAHDKYTHSVSFFITRPIRPYHYILGIGLSTLVYNLLGVAVIFAVGLFLLNFSIEPPQWLAIFGIVIAGWFIACALGFMIGMWGPRDPRTNTSLASLLGYSLTFLAPAYYPISTLPPGLQQVAYLFYTTNLSLLGKGVIRHEEVPLVSVGIVGLYLLISLIILVKLARWRQ